MLQSSVSEVCKIARFEYVHFALIYSVRCSSSIPFPPHRLVNSMSKIMTRCCGRPLRRSAKWNSFLVTRTSIPGFRQLRTHVSRQHHCQRLYGLRRREQLQHRVQGAHIYGAAHLRQRARLQQHVLRASATRGWTSTASSMVSTPRLNQIRPLQRKTVQATRSVSITSSTPTSVQLLGA
jgi:hypothetical protein